MNTILEDDFMHMGGCDRPDVSGRLYAYLDDPINEPAADEIEDHLLDCRDCRESFLTALNLRSAARKMGVVADGFDISDSVDVITIAEFG
ncbi:MAG TPA: zf-HC2 domain-containing protein [Pyrinomonadaceae bacterium]|nr:zf-HC2 domain-containing protein [Pyrinomonadaceae bacterium]